MDQKSEKMLDDQATSLKPNGSEQKKSAPSTESDTPEPQDKTLSLDPHIILSPANSAGTMTLWFEPHSCYLELPKLFARKVRAKSDGRIALRVDHIDSGLITIYQNHAIKLKDNYTAEVVVKKLVEMLLENARKSKGRKRQLKHSDA